MLQEAYQIEAFIDGCTRDDLDINKMLRYALVRVLEIIGEAASKVSSETRQTYSEIPWRYIIGMQNILIHDYGNVDLDILSGVSTRNTSELITLLTHIVETFND